jgi:insertion element IS1 protein InsB
VAFSAVKKNKRWLWKAYDRGTRRCVAWVVGGRDTATFRKLWEKIESGDRTYFTDDWESYAEVIPPEQHVIGKPGTRLIESDNSNTRHRLARMTRRTKVVSKSEEMIDLTIRLWTYFEEPTHFQEYQNRFLSIFG